MNKRRVYKAEERLIVNNRLVAEIVIDPHVDKHKDHIDDELIISLVNLLNGRVFEAETKSDGFDYYVSKILFDKKVYRLVWLQQEMQFYIGVITAFKDKGADHEIP